MFKSGQIHTKLEITPHRFLFLTNQSKHMLDDVAVTNPDDIIVKKHLNTLVSKFDPELTACSQ